MDVEDSDGGGVDAAMSASNVCEIICESLAGEVYKVLVEFESSEHCDIKHQIQQLRNGYEPRFKSVFERFLERVAAAGNLKSLVLCAEESQKYRDIRQDIDILLRAASPVGRQQFKLLLRLMCSLDECEPFNHVSDAIGITFEGNPTGEIVPRQIFELRRHDNSPLGSNFLLLYK